MLFLLSASTYNYYRFIANAITAGRDVATLVFARQINNILL